MLYNLLVCSGLFVETLMLVSLLPLRRSAAQQKHLMKKNTEKDKYNVPRSTWT